MSNNFDIAKVDIYQTIENLSKYHLISDPGMNLMHLRERDRSQDTYVTAREIRWACGYISLESSLRYNMLVSKEMGEIYRTLYDILTDLGFLDEGYLIHQNIDKALNERRQVSKID